MRGRESSRTQHQAILELQQGVREFNSIMMVSAWRQHQIPQGKGSVLQDCPLPPTPDPVKSPRLLPVLRTDQLLIEGSNNIPLGSINLLEGLTELRKSY